MRIHPRGSRPDPHLTVIDQYTESRWTRLTPDPPPHLDPALLAHVPARIRPARTHRSDNRLLMLTRTAERNTHGYLGPALLFDTVATTTRTLVAELRGDRAAPLPGGRFVIGLHGADDFDSWLHGPDGSIQQAWRSYGHYVPDPDGTIRVLERDSARPTAAHHVRLHTDGTVERGAPLYDGRCSAPVQLADGTLLFVDGTVLRAAHPELTVSDLTELISVPTAEYPRFHGELALRADRLHVALVERTPGRPTPHLTHRWTFALTPASPPR